MNPELDFDRCLAFINCQLQPPERRVNKNGPLPRAITISRQTGCGALAVAQHLAEDLQPLSPKEAPPWTVFDRDLVQKVLEDHNLPKRLARFMPEDRILEMTDTMDELFGLHPPSWVLVRQTAETILRFAKMGNVILVGRGGNVITSKLDRVFHVRLVGSLERRVERIQVSDRLDARGALELVRREDRGRKRYLKKYFNKNIDDPLLYHLTINTDLFSSETAASLIAGAVTNRW
jgi:cytidylate kinase